MQSIVEQQKIHFYQFMQIQLLSQYIGTGVQYMIKSLLNTSDKLISFRYYSHQISALICAVKNIFFLWKYKALYAENFYGLERVNKRSKLKFVLEIVVWILVPYLFRKLERWFNGLRDRQQNGQRLSSFSKIFTKIFPVIFCISKIASTVMKFKYLIQQQSKFYNIDYCITRTELSYLKQQKPSPYPIASFLKSPGLFLLLVAHKLASAYFTSTNKSKKKQQAIEVSAPIIDKKEKECPICGRKFSNPAVLRSSGYVFCYQCILPQVKKQGKCPVTGIASEESQVQVIYQ